MGFPGQNSRAESNGYHQRPDVRADDDRGDAYEGDDRAGQSPDDEQRAAPLPIVSCGALLDKYPACRPALIEGLLRSGEVMNVIAASKTGKTWLVLSLAIAVALGRSWLGRFSCEQGRVLIIDNELHPETIAHRFRTLLKAVGLSAGDVANLIDVVSLRGRLQDMAGLGKGLLRIPRGQYKLIIIDAFYRTLPVGTNENDNGSITALYNAIDHFADSLNAAVALVHHMSKGDQSSKNVTDVGAGAGAQSRAADTHLILRPHEEDAAVVLDAVVRSWPPLSPCCLRWDFPVWSPAPDLDPTQLRASKPRRRKSPDTEDQPAKAQEPAWTGQRFAAALGKPEPQDREVILEAARLLSLSDRKAQALLKSAVGCGYLFSWKEHGASGRTLIATVRPADPAPPPAQPTAPDGACAPQSAHTKNCRKPRQRKRKGQD